MTPVISVVIPTYNRGNAIRQTIDSVLSQTLPDGFFELIVVDDGSTDDTVSVITGLYGGDTRVRLIEQQNGGVAVARNRGLAEARGEFVAYLDHDDLWLPEKLQAQLDAFAGAPDTAVVYCSWVEVDQDRNPLPEAQQMTHLAWWKPVSGHVYHSLIPNNFIVSMSIPLIRTKAVREAGGFDPETVPCDDWDLWLRLARRHNFAYVPRQLVLYTRHAEQQSNEITRMTLGAQKVLIRQWPRLLTRPKKLWFVLCFSSYLKTAPRYYEAKEALWAARWPRVFKLLFGTALWHPLALFSPQWLYFLKRLATNNRAPY